MGWTGCIFSVFPILPGIALLFNALCAGGILYAKAAACDKFLVTVVLTIAAGMLLCGILLCLAGDNVCAIGAVFVFVVLWAIVLFAFAIFGFIVTRKGSSGHAVEGTGYKEFRLEDYSSYLRRRVSDDGVWRGIKRCLMKRGECQKLSHQTDYYDARGRTDVVKTLKFNGLQSGCCKPLDACGFAAINASESIYDQSAQPSSSPFAHHSDCSRFANGEMKCFDCDSCKAAFLDTLRRSWRTMSIVNFVVVALFMCGAPAGTERGD